MKKINEMNELRTTAPPFVTEKINHHRVPFYLNESSKHVGMERENYLYKDQKTIPGRDFLSLQ